MGAYVCERNVNFYVAVFSKSQCRVNTFMLGANLKCTFRVTGLLNLDNVSAMSVTNSDTFVL